MTVHPRLERPLEERLGADPSLHPALYTFEDRDPITEEDILAFLDHRNFPLISPGRALFAFRGGADKVELVRWIHAGVDRQSFTSVPGTNLWLLSMEVQDFGRFEYKLALTHGDHEEWVLDHLNKARASDPFGENSVCCTHGYSKPNWTIARGAPAGHIETFYVDSEVFGERRDERIYLPPKYDQNAPYPLVVIHDGDDFVTYADLSVSLDNLIDAGDIPPVIAALVQTRDRMGEYPRGRRHARYVVRELLPELEARLLLSDRMEDRVMLGASLGAVASLSTAFRFPGVFGGLVLQSGSFILDERKLKHREHPVFHRVASLVKALKRAPRLENTRAFVSTGELEGLAEENRALAGFLRDQGVDVSFKSAWDGHHWHNWRDQLRDGLMWVLNRTDNAN